MEGTPARGEPMSNIIEEYLVRLGVEVDQSAMKELDGGLKKIEGMVNKSTSFGRNVLKAGGLLGGLFLSVVSSATALTTSMAQQDRQMATLGATMMVSKGQAMAMKSAIDALGVSIDEIQVNPELREQYTQLLRDGQRMADSTGAYENAMRDVREVMFEFNRLKQEAQAALRWVAFYIIRDFSGPLQKVKGAMRSINEWIIQYLPKITRSIASGFGYIINMGVSFGRLVKTIWQRLVELWNSFSPGTKKAIAALTAMGAVLMAGPIGWITAGIAGILLLIDDFYGYLDGKDAAFGPIWDEVLKWQTTASEWWDKLLESINTFTNYIEDSETLKRYVRVLWDYWEAIFELAKVIGELLVDGLADLFGYLDDTGTVNDSTAAFYDFNNGLLDIAETVTGLIKDFTELLKKLKGDPSAQNFWKGIKRIIDGIVDATTKAIKGIGRVASIVAALLKGDIAGAKGLLGALGADIAGSLGFSGTAGEDEVDFAQWLVENGKDLGIGPEEAAAIAANIMRESSLVADPSSEHIDSNGLMSGGIAQWNGERLEAGKAWAANNGLEWYNKDTQSRYLLHEIAAQYMDVIEEMKNTSGVAAKARVFTRGFERPDMTDPDVQAAVAEQDGVANAIYARYTDRVPEPGSIKEAVKTGLEATATSDEARAKIQPYVDRDVVGVIKQVWQDGVKWWNRGSSVALGGNSFASTSGDTNINVNVNVANTNASPNAIGTAVASKVNSVLPNRNLAVIYNGGSGIA